MTSERGGGTIFVGLLVLIALGFVGPAIAVDGVIEINQTKAIAGGVTPGDTPGLPVTISTGTFANEPMSFRLTGPLFTSTTGNVIEILSPHVTLDLNGFAISCLLQSCSGNGVTSNQDNVTVANGTVRNFTVGVALSGNGAHVSRVRALNNTGIGIQLGASCMADDNISLFNGSEGIKVGNQCLVRGNTANANGSDGICTGVASNVTGNVASANTGRGLNLASNTGYSQNVIAGNTGGTVLSGISAGLNVCNGVTTCP